MNKTAVKSIHHEHILRTSKMKFNLDILLPFKIEGNADVDAVAILS